MPNAVSSLNAQSFIGGTWCELGGKRYPVVNPANGEELAEVAMGGVADVANVVAHAKSAFKTGRRCP